MISQLQALIGHNLEVLTTDNCSSPTHDKDKKVLSPSALIEVNDIDDSDFECHSFTDPEDFLGHLSLEYDEEGIEGKAIEEYHKEGKDLIEEFHKELEGEDWDCDMKVNAAG